MDAALTGVEADEAVGISYRTLRSRGLMKKVVGRTNSMLEINTYSGLALSKDFAPTFNGIYWVSVRA